MLALYAKGGGGACASGWKTSPKNTIHIENSACVRINDRRVKASRAGRPCPCPLPARAAGAPRAPEKLQHLTLGSRDVKGKAGDARFQTWRNIFTFSVKKKKTTQTESNRRIHSLFSGAPHSSSSSSPPLFALQVFSPCTKIHPSIPPPDISCGIRPDRCCYCGTLSSGWNDNMLTPS